MRKWIIAGLVVLALGGVAVVSLVNLNSLIERNRDFLIGQAEQALGRKVSLGEIEPTLFSGVGVRLTDFTMADDPRYSNGDFVRAKDLQIKLKFWPLLRKEFQVKTIVLHDPVIQIVRGADGEFNFSSIGKSAKDKTPAEEKTAAQPGGKSPKEAPSLPFSVVNIAGGDVHYFDKKDGSDLRARQIDLDVEDFDFDRPFSIKLAAALFTQKQNVNLTGKIGPLGGNGAFSQVPLNGELQLDPLDMSQLSNALPYVKNILPKDLDLAGVFTVKALKFNGTLKDLALDGTLDASRGLVRYGNGFQKAEGIPLILSTEARYGGGKLSLRKTNLTLNNLKLAAAGDVQMGNVTVLNLNINSEPASLDGWEKIFPAIARYRLSGEMELKAALHGQAGKGAAPRIQGTLTLKKASAKPPDFPTAIENIDTRIDFTGQRADINDMTLTLGKAKIRLAASVAKFSPLAITYKMSMPALWPADYRAALPEDRKADVIRNLQSEGQVSLAGGDVTYQGTFASSEGTLYNVAYKGLDAKLAIADGVANVRSLKINALAGTVQLDGQYSYKEPTPSFAVNSKVQGIDVKELYSALDGKAERDIHGRLNADMKLAGSGKSWEEIKSQLRGQGNAEVLQGALLNFNLADGALSGITGVPGLTKILSPALRKKYPATFAAKDTEFKELKSNFDVGDGRINIQDFRMAAADFSARGKGWADFTRRVDFRSTLAFSQPLSTDMAQSAREIKYLFNDQGQLEIPIALTGKMPNVKPKPDTHYLAQMTQRGFAREGLDEVKDRFLGGRKRASAPEDNQATFNSTQKKKKNSTEDMIRNGLKELFGK
jgi:AsmA protein